MLQLENPFLFAPVKTGYGTVEGNVTEKHLSFYKKRAVSLGAVIPEPFYLDKRLRELPTQMGIDKDDKIEGLSRLVSAIHDGGAKAVAHLNHPGRMANPHIPGNLFYSSSDQPCEEGGATPKRMTREDLREAVNLYVDAGVRAKKAGFDILELQYGHGYLPAQFLSPKVNDREDEYGGSLVNRARFALDILEKLKKAVDLPIICRISGDEMIPDGIKLPDMLRFSRMLQAQGADAIHVSAGTVCSTPPWFFQHMFVPKGKTWGFADSIRKEVSVPVIYVGQINTFEDIKELREKRGAEYVAIGRALVADPDFVGKYVGKVSGTFRPCLACAEGCLGGVKSGNGLQCLVNPELQADIELEHAAKRKK